MADMTARAETELRIRDDYLVDNENNQGAVIDCVERTPREAFHTPHLLIPASGSNGRFNQRGIHLNQSSIDAEAMYCRVNKSLLNNIARGGNVVTRYACGVTHPHSPRYILPYLTTARGISVFS